jgi:hypothetical protein
MGHPCFALAKGTVLVAQGGDPIVDGLPLRVGNEDHEAGSRRTSDMSNTQGMVVPTCWICNIFGGFVPQARVGMLLAQS